ncbi:ACP S-malonyltransferase [Haloplasma contractile]|uniref:Malonyl CoA-acyl carrier protein transacylase n=1 Tax=Haloplasma contractile SSD-17B TaxID=1033810 RepID=U2DSE0_9MOLU|nr:ACP S-malonyltransferase [Haloplasma contractile]ERJ11447.1 Malonyl CoA-acyl carrier protein transacylase [Haloplasma contractile SSD-17B]
MSKTAFLFSGQGSQYIGMAQDFYNQYDYVKEIYSNASDLLGYDLTELCFNENEKLNETIYTQPAVLVTSIAILEVIRRELNISPDVIAGFSLGEYTALYAAGVFDLESIIKLVKYRAEVMETDAKNNDGKMAAIIGMKPEQLSEICDYVSKEKNMIVDIANYNCPNQLVIGGQTDAVKRVCDIAKDHGAKRAIILKVSGGFHTELMNGAAKQVYDYVKGSTYNPPTTPLFMNCNALPLQIEELPELMRKQIKSSVYFEDTIRNMINEDVETFIEIGPGKVLSGFVKKVNRKKTILNVETISGLEQLKEL